MKRLKNVLLFLVVAVAICQTAYAFVAPEITGKGAIKAKEPVGFRVKAVMNIGQATDENTTEYGFLVTRKVFLDGDRLSNNDLVLDCKVYYIKAVAKGVVDGEYVDKFFEKTDYELFFTGFVHGIDSRRYEEIIVVRPYAVNDGAVYYGVPAEFSLYSAAKELKGGSSYDELSQQQRDVVDSIIISVEGEPYVFDRKDCRIVASTKVVKNLNPTYSVSYDLYNPFTGEMLYGVVGRKQSKNKEEISSMLLQKGTIVNMWNGVVQDTYDGYADTIVTEDDLVWISDCDIENGTMNVVSFDVLLKCKECVSGYVKSDKKQSVVIDNDTFVTVVGENVTTSTLDSIANKDNKLLCFNTKQGNVLYSDFVKAYASVDENGVCEYLIVVVNDNENSALDETCLNHTEFNVNFVVDGDSYASFNLLYGCTPCVPQVPEKEGHTFVGWSDDENGSIITPEEFAVTKDTVYYAVFEINRYTVTFYVDEEPYDTQIKTFGECPTLPQKPEVRGKIFVGWSQVNGGEVTEVNTVVICSDTSFYAVFEFKPNDPNLIEIMTRGLAQIKKIRITQNSKNDIARDLIAECMTYVLADANNGIYIDKSYIYDAYEELARKIKKAIKEDMTEKERSAFVNIFTNTRNVDKDVQDFLIEYFDIDMTAI